MKKLIIFLFLTFPQVLLAQNGLDNIRKKSHLTHVYKIPALDAIQFYEWDSIPINRFENIKEFKRFPADSVEEDILPTGFYVVITVAGSKVEAEVLNKTNIVVLAVNNLKKLQIDVRTLEGETLQNATVYVGKKKATYNAASNTFWVKQLAFEEKDVYVYAPGDTLITSVSTKDDVYPDIREQRKRNFKKSHTYRVLKWGPRKMKTIFLKKNPGRRSNATGYVVFNKPKYKPLDTVYFKAYILNKKWKQYTKPVYTRLSYYARGGYKTVSLEKILASGPGAYKGSFVLGDSIPTDIKCLLEFADGRQHVLVRETFSLEEYILDEIGTQTFTADKETYYKNDSMIFTASAKDANGLYVMDATARLILTTTAIDTFFKERMLVPDTLYSREVKLETITDTRFTVPADKLPAANIKIDAKLIFKNSNNELQEKKLDLKYLFYSKQLLVKQLDDSLLITYLEGGKEKKITGTMGMNDYPEKDISYPLSVKINPLAEDYSFYAKTETRNISAYHEVEKNYRLYFKRFSKMDTLGFILQNPYKIPVYYTVVSANKVIATGSSEEERIEWKKLMTNRCQAYEVRWQYYWAGKEMSSKETIGVLYKLLNVHVNGNQKIFPGESDSIKVKITDYKGRPAPGVNLTAVSYNGQFKDLAQLKEPPYLVKYKFKNGINRDGFYHEDPDEYILKAKYSLGKHKKWINIFSLDSMEYYKLLFPSNHYYDAVRYHDNAVVPQLAVHVVDNGEPQEIYLLYMNNELAYFNGATTKMKYSFSVFPKNVKLGIRLKNKYIEIDSLYIQPNFKHDISFDINNLPAHSRKFDREPWWSIQEMNMLEKSMLMVREQNQNISWFWQGDKLVKLPYHSSAAQIIGPFFPNNSITLFKENEFDLNFQFEPGYEYNFSRQISRLEKKMIFPNKHQKNYLKYVASTVLQLGDTLMETPVIRFSEPQAKKNPLLASKDGYRFNSYYPVPQRGRLLLNYHKDTSLRYIIISNAADTAEPVVLPFALRMLNLEPGSYNILLVNKYDQVHEVTAVEIVANNISCVNVPFFSVVKNHALLNRLQQQADSFYNTKIENRKDIIAPKQTTQKNITTRSLTHSSLENSWVISGTVSDIIGIGIPFASVVIKDGGGVQADAYGNYSIRVVKGDVLIVSQTAYNTVQVPIGSLTTINISLTLNDNSIAEVVVTSAFNTKRSARSVSANITVIAAEELTALKSNNALAGKVSGVEVRNPWSEAVRLRGENSLRANNDILYVVDGIIYNSKQNIPEELIADVTMLSASEATALFGADGASGAIVITTKRKTDRTSFKDYALWEPNFYTDKNGEAVFKVTYPDNVTSWKTYVVGMDRQNKIGKGSMITQSYKPMLAQLNLPLFLTEGDTSNFVTKAINYTADNYSLKTLFRLNNEMIAEKQIELKGNEAFTGEQLLSATGDTITASFSINSSTGFKDMEERKIPVFKKGLEQSEGAFYLLNKDTIINLSTKASDGELEIYAQNNTLDVLLSELDHLKKYPYYCVEQMTSKFRGLVMEKEIRKAMQQPFGSQKEMDILLGKIQKAQRFDGGWPWWSGGTPNLHVSNYITAALLPLRDNPQVESNVRNGLLYLYNNLSILNKKDLLATLVTLSDAGHEMNYAGWLNKIVFDSLSQHQQWQWVKIKQQQKLDYKKQLKYLLDKKIETMLGGIHWGDNNNLWYANDVATTIIAMEVIKKEPGMETIVNSIIQYFLEKKQGGYWRNTVESATILNAVLPAVLKDQKNFNSPAGIHVTGDTSFIIDKFPYTIKLNSSSIKNIDIKKQGGGMLYFTAYQRWFNSNPVPDNDQFVVQTAFEKNGQQVQQIQSGEKVKMIVTIKVLKDADYVMISMPIPAGCIFTNKGNTSWIAHKEYYKDKMMMYAERLPKGDYSFEATLEPRYNGRYHLNPAKVELMYYPVFSGNNEMKQIIIAAP